MSKNEYSELEQLQFILSVLHRGLEDHLDNDSPSPLYVKRTLSCMSDTLNDFIVSHKPDGYISPYTEENTPEWKGFIEGMEYAAAGSGS